MTLCTGSHVINLYVNVTVITVNEGGNKYLTALHESGNVHCVALYSAVQKSVYP